MLMYLEIPVEVSFSAEKGTPATHDNPSTSDEVYDISYDSIAVIAHLDNVFTNENEDLKQEILDRLYKEDL